MENKEGHKARRPLPVPAVTKSSPAQRPNTPIDEPIPSNLFYPSGTQSSQPLPDRPQHIGSGSTLSYFIPDQPTKDYREPELVSMQDDDGDSIPPLTAPDDAGGGWARQDWNRDFDANAWTGTSASGGWDNNAGTTDFYMTQGTFDIPISGRQDHEEKNWWDSSVQAANQRPGPGMLPPALLEELHDSDHSLFSVSVSNPPTHPTRQPSENPSISGSTSSLSSTTLYTTPPSEDEVRASVPHPNAYYCAKENGWVILSWKSSSVNPPLAASFENSAHPPLPNQALRRQIGSCTGDEGRKFNKTHHFHKYQMAIDALKLTPPLKVDDWEAEMARVKRGNGSSDSHKKDPSEHEDPQSSVEEGKPLDLYVCCQCSFYCVASDLISGIIPRKYLDSFVKDKRSNPPVGRTGEQAVVIALETVML